MEYENFILVGVNRSKQLLVRLELRNLQPYNISELSGFYQDCRNSLRKKGVQLCVLYPENINVKTPIYVTDEFKTCEFINIKKYLTEELLKFGIAPVFNNVDNFKRLKKVSNE